MENMTADVIVIGGGAAGMMAAVSAAESGARVLLLEKNEKLGKKIYITGKGRCNFTNACDAEDFFANVPCNASFLYSSIYGFDPASAMAWFEEHGLLTKVERGNRAFPASDHASDVTKVLSNALREAGVVIQLNTEAAGLVMSSEDEAEGSRKNGIRGKAAGVRLKSGKIIPAKAVVIATGGLSYPSTGSTGDGYRFAEAAGHSVTARTPSLVPLRCAEEDLFSMQGLSLKNVSLRVMDGKQKIWDGFGEMMFTHFGVTGPLVLTASAMIQDRIRKHPLDAEIDLKPALSPEKLDLRLLREFGQSPNKEICNVLTAVYPARMVSVILERSGIRQDEAVHDVTRAERIRLIDSTKHFHFTITALGGWNEAVITHGGVSVREVDPGSMESRKLSGLFFAGEVLDVDAFTGGFNLQIAWATGRAAGYGAADHAAMT